ncbi:MAG: nucleotide pyrophosphohydrolase [Planctomycetota bacterium]
MTATDPSADPAAGGSAESELTIRDAQATVDEWIKEIGVRYFQELTNLGQLVEEVGELSRLMTRIYGEQSFKSGKAPDDINAAVGDELADVLFVLICIANQTGVDLTEAFKKNIGKKTLRDSERHKSNEKLSER